MYFFNSYNTLLNIIRVGYLSKVHYVNCPFNSKIIRLLKKLVDIRYVSHFEQINNKWIRIFLIYDINYCPPYKFTKLLFKQSLRTYISYKKLFKLYKHDYGIIYILSTTQGLLTQSEAINEKIGGEIICVLYS